MAVPYQVEYWSGNSVMHMLTFNLLAHPLGWLLGIGVQFLNGFINYMSRLQGAVIEKLVITLPQLFIIYLMIFCIINSWLRKINTGCFLYWSQFVFSSSYILSRK